MTSARAYAKLNLALVVGASRPDGKHEVATVLQRVSLWDDVSLEPAVGPGVVVDGFPDTIVRRALEALAAEAGSAGGWRVRIEKRIPVAAGLGGGSSDAAASLLLANASLAEPLPADRLRAVAARVGADVPFFLAAGTQLATDDGASLAHVELPSEYWVVVVLPHEAEKESTAAVYADFDRRAGAAGFDSRRERLLSALAAVRHPGDLAALPPNDLASSAVAGDLERLGAFRADVSGAGPAVFGLFEDEDRAGTAAHALESVGRTWVLRPVHGR